MADRELFLFLLLVGFGGGGGGAADGGGKRGNGLSCVSNEALEDREIFEWRGCCSESIMDLERVGALEPVEADGAIR